MASRKRKRQSGRDGGLSPDHRPHKKEKLSHLQGHGHDTVKYPVLTQYYQTVQTLREYVLSKLPGPSKSRRKRIQKLGSAWRSSSRSRPVTDVARALGHMLDNTVVGCNADEKAASDAGKERLSRFSEYRKSGDDSQLSLRHGTARLELEQAEIVNFAVWLLCRRAAGQPHRKHLLCDGFKQGIASDGSKRAGHVACSIRGLHATHHNVHAAELKSAPWPDLLACLGRDGGGIMIDLLVDCGIFVAVEAGQGNLYQLSGTSISDMRPLEFQPTPAANKGRRNDSGRPSPPVLHSPGAVTFQRNRIMYARPIVNASGLVYFGLPRRHILNRVCLEAAPSELRRPTSTVHRQSAIPSTSGPRIVHLLMYIFPRQFGLHNVFTSVVDRTRTSQKLQDYARRDAEILKKYPLARLGMGIQDTGVPVPKRLAGAAARLVERLRARHGRCRYSYMIHHYCPAQGQVQSCGKDRHATKPTEAESHSKSENSKQLASNCQSSQVLGPALRWKQLDDLATPVSSVSAFCRAVLSKTVPDEFWGSGQVRKHNKAKFLSNVDRFLRLRRFETLSLHQVMEGMKVVEIEWLAPAGLHGKKCSQTDFSKRMETLYEFLYYLFDSLLMPMIRSNFYVTESSTGRYQLFFFRHDVWRCMAEPAMAALRSRMLHPIQQKEALRIMADNSTNFSQVRLHPKPTSMRPIMNLKRRPISRHDKTLGRSINHALRPASEVLKLEKELRPQLLGSSMFAVKDMHGRIKTFKNGLDGPSRGFYFAKVDVQSAFDSVPQDAVCNMLGHILGSQAYYELSYSTSEMAHHAPLGAISTRWLKIAKPARSAARFPDLLNAWAATRQKNTVFVHKGAPFVHRRADILRRLAAHISEHVVRIGKKFYRQVHGLPQGSVVSPLLCSYFYATLERKKLNFLQGKDCLLLRLIDDFLLITTDLSKAEEFVKIMHDRRQLVDWGVTVNPAKSLVNFDVDVAGISLNRVAAGEGFPYVGTMIDCKTLSISKDRRDAVVRRIFNSLTVHYLRSPGHNFKRKLHSAFMIQSEIMYFDTAHNSLLTVLTNIHTAFLETAYKMWAYIRCMPKHMQPRPRLVMDAISSLVDLAFVLLKGRSRKVRNPGYVCTVHKAQVSWLAMVAFWHVLARKQTAHGDTVAWLKKEVLKVKKLDRKLLGRVVRNLPKAKDLMT